MKLNRSEIWVLTFTTAAAIIAGVHHSQTMMPSPVRINPARSGALRITGVPQYDRLSLRTGSGRALDLPQLLFFIDRTQDAASGGRVHWMDSKENPLHYQFIRASYLTTDDLVEFNKANYLSDDRRFVIGSVVHYPGLARYGVELWEGDMIGLPLLRRSMARLQDTFFAPLAFKPNSDRQEALVAGSPGFPVISPETAYGSRTSLILNRGMAIGRLRIVDDADDADVGRGDIVILRTNPITLEPVAGLLTTHFSTPLSHVNLLAGTWHVPNAYVKDADKDFASLKGRFVVLDTMGDHVVMRAANAQEIDTARSAMGRLAPHLPQADLAYADMPSLAEQGEADVIRTGAKAANLGEVYRHVMAGPDAGFTVPPGFSIPFRYYDAYIRANGLDRRIDALLADPLVVTDRLHRHAALQSLRSAFMAGRIDPGVMLTVAARRRQLIGGGSVFARSSTNSEDLKGFNGAGLYSSVPNVVSDDDLATAIRTVWTSVWNDRAFEAREAAGIDHRGVKASVLVQLGENSETSGVMVTANPFDPSDEGSVFINAKRGLGMRVVEGRKVAEQLLYHGDAGTVQVLTRSNDNTMLTFDAKGGVRPVTIDTGRTILTDDLTTRLAHAGLLIQSWFHGAPQDIEWLTIGDRIIIVQSRPYQSGAMKK